MPRKVILTVIDGLGPELLNRAIESGRAPAIERLQSLGLTATDVTQALELLSVPLVAALVAVQTLDGGGKLVLDARVPALAVAAVLVWRKAPFPVVLIAAAATAALLRL